MKEAAALAEALELPLHVVYVISRSEFMEIEYTENEQSGSAIPISRIKESAANRAASVLNETVIDGEPVGLIGKPSEKVITYSEEVDARYIVVGPRQRSPTGKAVFSSVAQSIPEEAHEAVSAAYEEIPEVVDIEEIRQSSEGKSLTTSQQAIIRLVRKGV